MTPHDDRPPQNADLLAEFLAYLIRSGLPALYVVLAVVIFCIGTGPQPVPWSSVVFLGLSMGAIVWMTYARQPRR